MNIIEQLQQNERPFGLMSMEMRREMVRHKFKGHRQVYSCSDQWETHDPDTSLNTDDTYRLRPDYAEKPEIDTQEWPIFTHDGELRFKQVLANMSDIGWCIDMAFRRPDFIGFKFMSGQVEFTPIVFKSSSSTKCICQFRELAELEILHAVSVLFRRQK